ncbi:MAG: hypothetical protein B6D61_09875, partial [Bacteroidetes bacterium 4484_249]
MNTIFIRICFLFVIVFVFSFNLSAQWIDTQPVNDTICEGDDAVFGLVADSTVTLIHWQDSTSGTIWNNLSNIYPYSGVNTDTLKITNPDSSFENNFY